jgi:hypothetical protein
MVEVTIPDELAARLRAKMHDESTDLSVLVARAVTAVLEEAAAWERDKIHRAKALREAMARAGTEISEEEAIRAVDWRKCLRLPERGRPTDPGKTAK